MFASLKARIKEFLAGFFVFAKAEAKKVSAEVQADYAAAKMKDATAPTVTPKI